MQSKFTNKFDGEAQAASYDGLEVINSRHDGYRRAGFVLNKGRNELPPVDHKTLLALEADPFLTVTIIGEPYVPKDDNNPNGVFYSDNKTGAAGGETDPARGTNHPSLDPNLENGAGKNGQDSPQTPSPPTRDELLLSTANDALVAADPSIYFNQDGSPSVTKWKALLNDNSLTKDDITKALDAAKAAQKPE